MSSSPQIDPGPARLGAFPGIAMVLEQPGTALALRPRAFQAPSAGQVLVAVSACGVCRTDLHLLDGELPHCSYPRIPGHEIVGRIAAVGPGVSQWKPGQRVGIPWLGRTCGHCAFCASGQENLCNEARFHGYDLDGGYASHCLADAAYIVAIPDSYGDVEAAPLLCAGLIGYRCLARCGEAARRVGLFGFGAAAHVIAQVAQARGQQIYAFTRPGDVTAQRFACSLGATWAGDSGAQPPVELDAAIIFAPDGGLVPIALRAVRRGGKVICGGIHMSDIPAFAYALLWGERSVESIANLTRADAREFMAIAAQVRIRTHTIPYPLAHANRALADLRHGRLSGAAVLVMAADEGRGPATPGA